MLIALDATYLVDPHPSGISVYSHELLDGLAREHPDDVYLRYYRLKQFRRAPASPFPNVRRRLLLPPLLAHIPWSAKGTTSAAKQARNMGGYEVPVLRGLPNARPAVFHALNQRVDRRIGKAVVSTFHDLFVMAGEYSSPDFRARFTAQAKRAAAASDLIIAVSEFTRQQVISFLGVEAARVRVVPHGVHLPAHVPDLVSREKMILCVGALQLRKNVTRLVQAFERLSPLLRSGWTLVLAGSTAGYGAAEILSHIESSPAKRQIQLKGYVTTQELSQLYSRALIFAFPSLDEGFGIPVLEAMANGVPVVTSNRSALPQVAGDAALAIDPYDVDALSNALARLMEDSDLRSALRQRGLERAALFPWHHALASTYQIYRELAQ